MTNAVTGILKADQNAALKSGIIYPLIFTFFMYIINRDVSVILVFTYIFSFFYIEFFLTNLHKKEKLYSMLPITSESFIQSLYTLIGKTLAITYICSILIYVIALQFSEVGFEIEDITFCISICCLSAILVYLCVFLHYKIERGYRKLAKFTTLILTMLIGVCIFMVFDKIGVAFWLQVIAYVIVTVGIIIVLFKSTIRAYQQFELKS